MTARPPARRSRSKRQPRSHPRSLVDAHDATLAAVPENASPDVLSPLRPNLVVVPHTTSMLEVLRRPPESAQYTSIAYTDRLDDIGAAPSIDTIGDSFDNAMAESTIGLFKTELHRNPAALRANGGHRRGLHDLEIATCAWMSWFNDERFHSELDDLTPAEIEQRYYLQQAEADAA